MLKYVLKLQSIVLAWVVIQEREGTCTSLCVSCCVPLGESKGQNIYSLFVCCSLQVLEMALNSSCMEALHSSAG